MLYPMTFEPVLKDYIWGGFNLARVLPRPVPTDKAYAEAWTISAHQNGNCVVENGALAGQSLAGLVQRLGLDLLGTRAEWAHERGKFPLLVKVLDACRELSVQVHPDDAYALANEGNELGKTEMWVVLSARPGAEIILGVTPGTTRENFRQAIVDGKLEPHLHRLAVKAGDVVCVPAGSLHAILDGLLIAEIQQNSDTTYRVYDWNRLGHDGKPRQLHVDRALDVINFGQVAPSLVEPKPLDAPEGVGRFELCRNRYFVVERWVVPAGMTYRGNCDGSTLEIWGAVEGQVSISGGGEQVGLRAIDFALLPAGMGDFTITTSKATTLLRTYLATK